MRLLVFWLALLFFDSFKLRKSFYMVKHGFLIVCRVLLRIDVTLIGLMSPSMNKIPSLESNHTQHLSISHQFPSTWTLVSELQVFLNPLKTYSSTRELKQQQQWYVVASKWHKEEDDDEIFIMCVCSTIHIRYSLTRHE